MIMSIIGGLTDIAMANPILIAAPLMIGMLLPVLRMLIPYRPRKRSLRNE